MEIRESQGRLTRVAQEGSVGCCCHQSSALYSCLRHLVTTHDSLGIQTAIRAGVDTESFVSSFLAIERQSTSPAILVLPTKNSLHFLNAVSSVLFI